MRIGREDFREGVAHLELAIEGPVKERLGRVKRTIPPDVARDGRV